jgi:glycosyltransferase involved in cell wall biosynthesis
VVATRSGSFEELVEDGVTGLLAEPGDARSFADAIEKLARDGQLREGMRAAARKRAERFTVDRSVEATLAVYSL